MSPPVDQPSARGAPPRRESETRGFGWSGRGAAGRVDLYPTRGLSKFVKALAGRPAPVVVDMGQAVGVNVTFLGEKLGCKLHVDDLLSDLATWGPRSEPDDGDSNAQRGGSPASRVLAREDESVDGFICWDLFDYLDADAAEALGCEITRVLTPGGVVFLCHAAERCEIARPVQHEIVDDVTLRYRPTQRRVPPSRVWQSRAITKMFADLAVSDSFLLTNRMREVVFRKASSMPAVD